MYTYYTELNVNPYRILEFFSVNFVCPYVKMSVFDHLMITANNHKNTNLKFTFFIPGNLT